MCDCCDGQNHLESDLRFHNHYQYQTYVCRYLINITEYIQKTLKWQVLIVCWSGAELTSFISDSNLQRSNFLPRNWFQIQLIISDWQIQLLLQIAIISDICKHTMADVVKQFWLVGVGWCATGCRWHQVCSNVSGIAPGHTTLCYALDRQTSLSGININRTNNWSILGYK